MKAIVLCPGPSLAAYSAKQADLIIGVNRAVLAHRCDWWSATDRTLLKEIDPGYRLNLFTDEQTLVPRPERFPMILRKQMTSYYTSSATWPSFSSTSALVLAAHLGALTIDVFGDDKAGFADWDGHIYARPGEEGWRTRSAQRWQREWEIWNQTIALLARDGVNVRRHGPAC